MANLGVYAKKSQVLVVFEIKEDGKAHFALKSDSDSKLDFDDYAKILAGGLAMAIRASENEGELMTDIMNYLQMEFVNNDAFNDLKKF